MCIASRVAKRLLRFGHFLGKARPNLTQHPSLQEKPKGVQAMMDFPSPDKRDRTLTARRNG